MWLTTYHVNKKSLYGEYCAMRFISGLSSQMKDV